MKQFNKITIKHALILAAFILWFFPIRLDLSPNQSQTLSSASKKIIKQIDTKVIISVFISSDIPPRLIPLKNDVKDLVNEYRGISGRKIKVEFLDPKKDAKSKKKAQTAGIPELQFQQVEKDKYALSGAYFGIEVESGGKKQVLPQATTIPSLEHDLTSSIYKLTQKDAGKIAFIGVDAKVDPRADDVYSIRSTLSKQTDIAYPNMNEVGAPDLIRNNINTLIFFGNTAKVSDRTKETIENYLLAGKSIIFMIDGVDIGEKLSSTGARHGLFDLLSKYGITLHKDLVVSTVSDVANFSTNATSFFAPYPLWVKTTNFNKKDPLFATIGSLVFPWASSTEGGEVLVQSQDSSWIQKDTFFLAPNEIPIPKKSEQEAQTLIVEKQFTNGTKIMVIPTSRFVREQFITKNSNNVNFLINVINEYALGGALSGIRTRELVVHPLKQLSDSGRDGIKYAAVLSLPTLFAFYGIWRLIKVRK